MKPEVTLMWSTPDPEFQIIRAARVCYQSDDKSDSKWEVVGMDQADDGQVKISYPMMKVHLGPEDEGLLEKIMTNNHNACLRFASASFNIKGISRVCSHHLVRIGHFGLLQKSDRYSKSHTDLIPEELRGVDDELDGLVDNATLYARGAYEAALEKGVSKELARYILPNAAQTEINMCSNFQGWKHFLKIRLSKKVQSETRVVAAELCKELYKLAPRVFEKDFDKLDMIGL